MTGNKHEDVEISDLDEDEWHHGQIDVKNVNKDSNYQVSTLSRI